MAFQFKKSIAISPEDLEFIDEVKGELSKAKKLAEIMDFYRDFINAGKAIAKEE